MDSLCMDCAEVSRSQWLLCVPIGRARLAGAPIPNTCKFLGAAEAFAKVDAEWGQLMDDNENVLLGWREGGC